MAVDDGPVKVCQQEIIKLDLQLKAIIQDIRQCDGPMEALLDLNQEARDKTQEIKGRIEELGRLAKEQDKEVDQVALLKHADNHHKQLVSTQTVLRQANLACQMSIEKAEKDNLLHGGVQTRQRVKSSKENLAKATGSITENLMSVSRMMSSQVEQSQHTMNTLVSSSQEVSKVHGEFDSMSVHIQQSHKLLTKYSRRECTDKLLIFLALVFFFATVVYILKKRLFSTAEPIVQTT